MLSKNKTYSSELLFKEAQVLQISQLYINSEIRIVKKNEKYRVPIIHNIPTRYKADGNVALPLGSFSAVQRSLLYTGPKIYNILPTELKTMPL